MAKKKNEEKKDDKVVEKKEKTKNKTSKTKAKKEQKSTKKEEFNNSKELYTVKEVIVIMLFSLGIGFLICFGCVCLLTGKNYLAINKDLDKVVDTYYAIVDNYYGKVDKKELVEGAIEGMLSRVGDSYTSYSTVEDTTEFNETITGNYEGIGCQIATYAEENKTVVTTVFEDSPAEKAGLKVGDIIKKVDDVDYTDKTSEDIADKVKDSGKEKVKFTIDRDGKEKEITINISKVEIPYVSSEIYDQNNKKIGYIAISLFSGNSYKQFKNKLEKLEKENIDGLVIDVRNNQGGYLSSVTNISNLFLEKGSTIYQLEDSKGKIKKKDTTKEKRNYKVAVLINEESASASEILASAIKESYNGYVVGVNSFGKGTVQQTKKLLDGSMIKYTTQKWLTPKGNSINGEGVTPTNIVVLSEKYFDNPSPENDNQLEEALELVSK